MILIVYRLMCGALAALVAWALLTRGTRQQKAVMAMMLVPLVLRFLLIK